MPPSFAHHFWATRTLMAYCAPLDPAVLAAVVPGTYGSIRDTIWHVLDAEASYIASLHPGFDASRFAGPSLDHVPLRIELHRTALAAYLTNQTTSDISCWWTTPDGAVVEATHGILLAQMLHHAAEHRTQIATVLGSLGFDPPSVSAWEFALATGAARIKGLDNA